MDDTPEVLPVPDEARHRAFSWFANKRRPAFLLALTTGLVLFLAWLPQASRASLVTALSAQRLLLSLLFIFALITLSLIWSTGQRLDIQVFLFFNLGGYHSGWLNKLMFLITQLGSMPVAFMIAGICFLLNYRRLGVEIILGTLTAWLLVETIKALADRDRPFLTIKEARIIGWRERGDSFPSGHTTQIFFLVTLCMHRFALDPLPSLGLYAIALLVGITRIYVGAHYPRDVLGGAMLGSVWAILVTLVDPYLIVPRL